MVAIILNAKVCLFREIFFFSKSPLSRLCFTQYFKVVESFFPPTGFFISPQVTLCCTRAAVGSGLLLFYCKHLSRYVVNMNTEERKRKQLFSLKVYLDSVPKSNVSFLDPQMERWTEYRLAAVPGISLLLGVSPHSWLKMALPYPHSASLLSSVRWRLTSSCYCSNTRLIYRPWPERGATESGLIHSCALCSPPEAFLKVQLKQKLHQLLDLNRLCLLWSL